MIGIYLHIPFCKKACSYCNFHFSTNTSRQQQMVDSLVNEVSERLTIEKMEVDSIYFGGGTPSLLSIDQVNQLLDIIFERADVSDDVEITFEMNPDDFDAQYIRKLSLTKVNRISIGIQSFFDVDLQFMGRAHSAEAAHQSIVMAQEMGFDKITVDLIYGTPTLTDLNWQQNLEIVASYRIPHLSCYALTVEDKTELSYQIQQGKIPPLNDDKAAHHFDMLSQIAASNGYNQYEISNFCRDEAISHHNTKYWMGHTYLGFGPSAHSFDGKRRRWNISNNALYMNYLEKGLPYFEIEHLTEQDIYNEMVLTGLRTKWGVTQSMLEQCGAQFLSYFNLQAQELLANGLLIKDASGYTLSHKGKLLSNQVISDLFHVDPM